MNFHVGEPVSASTMVTGGVFVGEDGPSHYEMSLRGYIPFRRGVGGDRFVLWDRSRESCRCGYWMRWLSRYAGRKMWEGKDGILLGVGS